MSKRKSKRDYTVSGKVIDKATNKAIHGLRVEAWDKDEVEDDLLGTATTNKKGVFSITFDDSKFADEIHDEDPDIYFKVYYSKRLILSTEKNVLLNVSKDLKNLKLQVVMPTKDVVKFEEKVPPAPVVRPSIKDSEDLLSTHEQPKDEAKPSPAPLSVTGVIRHHDGLPTLYVKKTELTVKLKPAVIKAATESHNIQISETIQQHITALMSVGVEDISKLGSISIAGNVTPSPGVLHCKSGSFSTSDLEEKSYIFSRVHKVRMIGDATSQPLESTIDQVGGTATILKATPFPRYKRHATTAHRSVMDTDSPLHTTTAHRSVMDTDSPTHTTSESETGTRWWDEYTGRRRRIKIDLSYWAASEITIADNTTIILQQPHHWLFIIADKINIGTNVTFSWELKSLGMPGRIDTKPPRSTPDTSTTMSGRDGRNGDRGREGDPGYPGDDGPIVELWAKEINRLPSGIFVGGQMGGKGGKGQNGQRGQRGARGRKWIKGLTSATCKHGPGNGGDGGRGRRGGKGGIGGSGGDGGRFDVFTLPEQIGIISQQKVSFNAEGGLGGEKGDPGRGGRGGNGGNAGTDRSNVGCATDYGKKGKDGDDGPEGRQGEPGEPGKTQVEAIQLHQISEDSFIERFNRAAIFDLSEEYVTAGDTVEAIGQNFSSTDTIYVNDKIAETTYIDNSLMSFIVPSVEGGSQKSVYVKTHGNKKSNYETINIVPKINWIEQDGKKSTDFPIPRFTPGKIARIVGSGFTDDLRIRIDNTPVIQDNIAYVDHEKVDFVMLRPDNVTPNAAGEEVTVKMILEADIQSDPISIILDTFVIAVFGDSIQWGQGLREDLKFHSIVSDHISNGLLGVYKKVHAHSGATIGLRNEEGETSHVSASHEEDAVHGEVPSKYPTVMQQLDKYSYATGNPPDIVDLILIDGGINDINIRNIINPLSDYDLVGECQAICYEDMKDLLEKTLISYPKAKIIVTGYYRPVTDDSSLTKLILYFAGLGMIGGASAGGISGAGSAGGVVTGGLSGAFAGGVISASQKGTIVSRCNTFAEEANENLQDAVDAVNEEQSSDDPRIFFAEPDFKDENAIFADESWLWGIEWDLGPADDDQIGGVETKRQEACDIVASRDPERVDGFMCKRASIGHPNVAGAKEYARVIISELDKFYPEKP